MKKILSGIILSAVLVLPAAVMAEGFQPNTLVSGGFQGPGLPTSTVAEALKMRDDTPVVLQGKVEKSLGKENYLFSDETGSVTVEIDHEDWRGQTVTPSDTVIIKGEVEKDFWHTKIDVDSIELKK